MPLKIPSVSGYQIGEMIATREAYGNALAKLCHENRSVIAIDGEVSNSTYSGRVKEVSPSHFIEGFIAEQNMIGMALGLAVKNQKVFASTFSAFLSRAHDQLRMAALSKADFVVCGSHSGVSIGEDGASQMGLEDIALFRTLPGATILYPCDAISAEKLVFTAAKISGLVYLRTTRPKTSVIYSRNDEFPIEDFKVVRHSLSDKVVLAGAGITVHEALKAQHILARYGVHASVVDLYCVEPFPKDKLLHFVKTHGNCIIVAEDHYHAGGIGEKVLSEFANEAVNCLQLAVNKIPHSGTKDELLEYCEIDYKTMIKKTLFILSHKHYT
jgi:transketolase